MKVKWGLTSLSRFFVAVENIVDNGGEGLWSVFIKKDVYCWRKQNVCFVFFFIDDCEGNVCIACSLSRGFFFFNS